MTQLRIVTRDALVSRYQNHPKDFTLRAYTCALEHCRLPARVLSSVLRF